MLAQQNEWPRGWGGMAIGAALILASLFCWGYAGAFADAARSRPKPSSWLRLLGWDYRWRQWNSVACSVAFGAIGLWAVVRGAYEISPWVPRVALPLVAIGVLVARITRPTRQGRRRKAEAEAADALRQEREVYERLEAVRRKQVH